LTMAGLARQLKMAVSTLWGIAKPGHSTTLRTVAKIARALDMKALDLLDEVADTEPERPPRRKGTGRGMKS
jgi:transcriptional regulator with XRE-family HTH domain